MGAGSRGKSFPFPPIKFFLLELRIEQISYLADNRAFRFGSLRAVDEDKQLLISCAPKGLPVSIKQIVLRTFVLGAIAASATLAAKADTLDFTLTGKGTDITFALTSSPTVSSYSTRNGDFTLDNVILDVNGFNITTDLSFYDGGSFGGGLAAELFHLTGSQIFTGSLNDPTFKTGNFTLTSNSDSYSYCDSGSYNLSIVDVTKTVTPTVTPEPSSILLLATGVFALVGAGAVKRLAA